MTNLEKTAEILGLKEGEPVPELQNLVVDVRGSILGSRDPMSTSDLEKVQEALLYRLDNWQPSSLLITESKIIDECIYLMCTMCVNLIRKELKERKL